ncbi:L-ascorbate 6-phosphate lactonase [Paenibacillus sp. V4I3]|uniref:MBL fold metallo-hydrolase n=1 Tax=unclassified Paenibacillus TaxID=185978 RepID=UPI002784832E|nr:MULTISPECIES: MBL fold metallo-hydrolase [unclassified Paenibacillus]MDQ0877159.1 L-ascorbate 6-phosphate lactonase [Paenibacillus sp. V4I3]MDQ0886961.1 L-ascorbate 6-phosphate lactonase [Paenibacillus sp. V4I9]
MSNENSHLKIQYIGQVGVILRKNDTAIAIDPYLTDSVDHLPGFPEGFWQRRYEPPVKPETLTNLDLVLCTHEHMDHMDPDTLLSIALASPKCQFGAPKPCLPALEAIGISAERLHALGTQEAFQYGADLIIHPIPAWHEERVRDVEGWDHYLGYILQWEGLCIYHAGDTLLTEELVEALSGFIIDIGFLPINGRDIFRNRLGVVGNMNALEAADLTAHLKFDIVVPVHFDMYANNSEGIAPFVDRLYQKHPGQKFHIFQPGETLVYMK